MRLSKLVLRRFRNISEIEFEPAGILNLLVGENAQGKTSLIEGIYFLSTLRSFRTSRTQDLIMAGATGSAVEGHVESQIPAERGLLKVKVDAGLRKTFVDGKPVPPSKFVTRLRSVVFSPESLAAIKAGPELRRELIDQAVFQSSPQAAHAQQGFSKALRQRNALLKQIRDNELPFKTGMQVLESLDETFLDHAAEVVFDRLRLLDQIQPDLQEILSNIMGEKTNPQFSYQSGGRPWGEREFTEARARLAAELSDNARRVAETSLGLTLTGPHRHDISFLFNENDSRIFCSQGQQRALILAFKIAEIMYHKRAFGSYPLLLLDDVLSEFDEKKRRYLVDFLRTHEAQTFLTTTEMGVGAFHSGPNQTQALADSSVFRIQSGTIRGCE